MISLLMNSLLLVLLCSAWLTFIILYLYHKVSSNSHTKDFFYHMKVLDYVMDQAYNVIYKEQVNIYSLSAEGLDDAHLKKAMFDYCKLTETLLGKKLLSQLVSTHGQEAINKMICLNFIDKYENDEIRKKTRENLIK